MAILAWGILVVLVLVGIMIWRAESYHPCPATERVLPDAPPHIYNPYIWPGSGTDLYRPGRMDEDIYGGVNIFSKHYMDQIKSAPEINPNAPITHLTTPDHVPLTN